MDTLHKGDTEDDDDDDGDGDDDDDDNNNNNNNNNSISLITKTSYRNVETPKFKKKYRPDRSEGTSSVLSLCILSCCLFYIFPVSNNFLKRTDMLS